LRGPRVRAATLRRADETAFRAWRAAAFTLRRPRAAFFFDTFGSMRRAPRTARRAAPVAVRATPAAMSVAIDAAPLAASLIVAPALLMMPFFAMGSRSRRNFETFASTSRQVPIGSANGDFHGLADRPDVARPV
jgi:hypothetical protein